MVARLLQMSIMGTRIQKLAKQTSLLPGACCKHSAFPSTIAFLHLKSLALASSHYTIELCKYSPLLGQTNNILLEFD